MEQCISPQLAHTLIDDSARHLKLLQQLLQPAKHSASMPKRHTVNVLFVMHLPPSSSHGLHQGLVLLPLLSPLPVCVKVRAVTHLQQHHPARPDGSS
jgi:hypothetical protein